MHPEIAKTLIAQRHDELAQQAAECRRIPKRRLPRWHVSWSRTILSPAEQSGAGGRESSWVIIISANRTA
jgi:hypothetical protein